MKKLITLAICAMALIVSTDVMAYTNYYTITLRNEENATSERESYDRIASYVSGYYMNVPNYKVEGAEVAKGLE